MDTIMTVVGARPQFIKAGILSPFLCRSFKECLVHTGQHYDTQMSDIFFKDLDMAKPDYCLNVGSGSHAVQTADIIKTLEPLMCKENPKAVLVYGDTNSTLAATIVAVKLHIPVIHIEAGLRSYDRLMPEENNRVMTDHVSQLLCAPSLVAVRNLKREGLGERTYMTGDVMCDAIVKYLQEDRLDISIVNRLNLEPKRYAVVTLHRAEITSRKETMEVMLKAISSFEGDIVFPVHPRTKQCLQKWHIWDFLCENDKWHLLEPLGYFDFLSLLYYGYVLITDSGGAQKESALLGVPTLTLRDKTEWVETVATGWNQLMGYSSQKLRGILKQPLPVSQENLASYYGNGMASQHIVALIGRYLCR